MNIEEIDAALSLIRQEPKMKQGTKVLLSLETTTYVLDVIGEALTTLRDLKQELKENGDIPQEWDNRHWNANAAEFLNLVQQTGGFWCMDMQLKYLNIYVDTRSGHFKIKDRDGNEIDIHRVLKVMQKWVSECGYNDENPHLTRTTPTLKTILGDL